MKRNQAKPWNADGMDGWMELRWHEFDHKTKKNGTHTNTNTNTNTNKLTKTNKYETKTKSNNTST